MIDSLAKLSLDSPIGFWFSSFFNSSFSPKLPDRVNEVISTSPTPEFRMMYLNSKVVDSHGPLWSTRSMEATLMLHALTSRKVRRGRQSSNESLMMLACWSLEFVCVRTVF